MTWNSQLLTTEGRQDLSTKLIRPVVEKFEGPRGGEPRAVGETVQLCSECRRRRSSSRIPRAMPMEKENLIYPTSLWHQRRRVREPELAGRDGEPRGEISPAMEYVELAAFVV